MLKKIYASSLMMIMSFSMIAQNTWTQKANFTGNARYTSDASFVIGHYGFTGCGTDGTNNYNDFYKWNQTNNTWSAITNYPGAGYYNGPIGFNIEGKGYVGLGLGSGGAKTDLWCYDTATGNWTAKATFPGTGRYDATVFTLGHKAYVVGGSQGGPPYLNQVWMYDAHQNNWTQMNNFPGGDIEGMVGFSIGNYGYVAGGWNSSVATDSVWKYDTTSDTWTSIAKFPLANGLGGTPRAFVIGTKAYVCIGTNGAAGNMSYGYVYDTLTKAWTIFTNMGANGIERHYSVAFAIGNYGYICTGKDSLGNNLNDLWQYYPCGVPLAVQETQGINSSIKLFPNPSNGMLYLEYTGTAQKNATFMVTDMTGRTVMTQRLSLNSGEKIAINGTDLAQGFYLYRITGSTNSIISSGKFIIAK